MIEPVSAHGLTVTYSGNGKYTVTWPSYPSDNGRAVRRTLRADSLSNYNGAATLAAESFVAWFESVSPLAWRGLFYRIESLSIAGTSNPNKFTIHLSGEWV